MNEIEFPISKCLGGRIVTVVINNQILKVIEEQEIGLQLRTEIGFHAFRMKQTKKSENM